MGNNFSKETSNSSLDIISDEDLKLSMNIHRRILDHEIESIDNELQLLLKNKDTIDYLITLLKRRERLEDQVHKIETDLEISG